MPIRLIPGFLCALITAAPAVVAHAQNRLDATTAEQLVETLSQPVPSATRSMTRSLSRPTAKLPDAATNLCHAPGNAVPQDSSGQKTRALYVSDAPKVDLNVRFALDSQRVMPDAEPMIDALGQALKSPELRDQKFIIAGHTDKRGAEDYNKRLSCERALAVRDYLIKKHGIARDRLVILGFGFEHLLDMAQPEGEVNRRVEVRRF